MSDPALSTTSYAMLGYLAVRPWAGYELAKQMGRTFRHFWPHAESGIYKELKRLVGAGLARAEDDHVGRRARTRYSITSEGVGALRAWLSEPHSNGLLESEGLVRVLFSDHGTKASLKATLETMVDDADTRAQLIVEIVRDYLVTGGQFPHRSHINVLIACFLIDFADMVHTWAAWADDVVDTWPDVTERPPDQATMDLYWQLLERDTTRRLLERQRDQSRP